MPTYRTDLEGIDWTALKATLAEDDFDNGRTPEELQRSFQNSEIKVFAEEEGRIVGKARALSDGVCNAYVVDVWVHTPYRRQGIATEMMRQIMAALPGQHIYLFTDDAQELYRSVGFKDQPRGMGIVVGSWLGRG